MTEPAMLAFLSWARAGLGGGHGVVDPLSGDLPAAARIALGYRVNTRAERTLSARVHGPGDVTALDARQVVRTDPQPGDDTFPPHLFPLVEFDRPELPWLLTPARPAERDRLRPWLVLVVLDRDRAQLVAGSTAPDPDAPSAAAPGAALPVLRCRLEDLPDLAESHLWAHVQVSLDGPLDDARLDRLLADAPDRTTARLLCPRRLEPRRPYLACVVPAFDAGRRAGLGLDLTEADLATLSPAWSPGAGDAPPLPVYHHWEFATGDAGSFEALVARLQGRGMPRSVGILPVDVSRPGAGLPDIPAHRPGGIVELEGALRSPVTFAAAWDASARAAFETALRPRLDVAADDLDEVLIPPVYGLAHAGRRHFIGDAEQVTWLRDLNLDPRYRAVAALGTRAVQDHQEDLVAAAWEQVVALADVNRTLRQGQLGRTVAQAIYDRRVDRTRPGSALSDDRLLQLSRPVHDALGTAAVLRPAVGLRAATTPGFRKVTRPGRGLARLGGAQVATPLARLASRAVTVNPALPVPRGMATVEGVSSGESMRRLTGDRVRLPVWAGPPSGPTNQPVPADPLVSVPGAAMPNRVFATTTDGRLLSRVTSIGGFSGWQDHGRPPGASALRRPTAIRDLTAYVAGSDGHVKALAWDGDRWNWTSLPLPGGVTIRSGSVPMGAWSDSSRPVGDIVHNGTFNLLWVVGADGVLYQLAGQGVWVSHGTPGVSVVGNPGSQADTAWSVLVTCSDGWMWDRRTNPTTGQWEWVRVAGGSGSGPLGAGDCAGLGAWRFAAGSTASDLYATLDLGIIAFGWLRVRTDLSAILGTYSRTNLLLSTTSGAVIRFDAAAGRADAFSAYLPPPPGYTAGSPIKGAVRTDGTVVIGLGGRYLEGSGGNWRDIGVPRMAGVGAPTAPPPAHRRWRPTVGIMGSIVASHVDSAAGGDRLHLRVGSDVGYDADVRAGWALRTPMPDAIGTDTQGMGIALADVRGRAGDTPRRDLVALWVTEYGGGNFPTYRVGWDLDSNGNPTSWSDVKRCPTPVATSITSGGALTLRVPVLDADIDVVDLDGDGRAEVVLCYVTGHSTPRANYRIGWCLDPTSGEVTRGWSESQPLPAPPPGQVLGMGACVVDTTGTMTPDLVVLYVTRPAPGAALTASYRVGRGLNARGLLTGGWSQTIPVEGGPLPAALQGTSLTAADFTGSEAADLLLLLVEDGPTDNVGSYRVGLDVSPNGRARSWTGPMPVPGWFGWVNHGAGVAVGDIEAGVFDRKKAFATAFTAASQAHQGALTPAQQLAASDDAAVALATVATAARTGLQPADRVDRRVAGRVAGVDLTSVVTSDALSQVLAAPRFDLPAYELVRDIAADYLLPGVSQVPRDTVSLLRASPAFIEAFMVGLNHEMAREFLWRELPADRTATYFRTFWNRTSGAPDVPPIASWHPSSRLGESAGGLGGPDMAVVLVRGELLRRHPNTEVYAIRAAFAPDGTRVLTDSTRPPDFRGSMSPDLTFFGFPFTVAEARGTVGGDAGWFVAFAEHPTEPRFGLDEPPDPPVFGAAPPAWSDLDWARVVPNEAALAALLHVPAELPFPRSTELPVRTDHGPGADLFRWAENAAHTAHITLQRPVLMAIHATDLLAAVSGDWHVTHVVRTHRAVSAVAGRHPDGSWWRLDLAEAIQAIERHERLYVQRVAGAPANLVVVHSARGAHLRTKAGGGRGNNLSALPDLPPGITVNHA